MKNKSFLIVCLIILIVIMTLFIKDTYSRYAGNSQASAAITVAKWAFETDNAQNTINVSLSETYDPTTLVNGKIAPGTRGSFAIVLKNPTSETSVDFSVSIGSISNVPANLKFYKDSSYTQELTVGSSTITGQLEKKDSTELPVTIYWRWEYSTSTSGDTLDTSDGIAARTLTVPVVITGIQTDPTGAAATTHID